MALQKLTDETVYGQNPSSFAHSLAQSVQGAKRQSSLAYLK